MRHGAGEIGVPLRSARLIGGGNALDVVARQAGRAADQASPPRIPRQVGGNTIERIAAMRLAVVRPGGAEKAIERFLQQVVRQLTVTSDPCQVGPYSARGPLIEC